MFVVAVSFFPLNLSTKYVAVVVHVYSWSASMSHQCASCPMNDCTRLSGQPYSPTIFDTSSAWNVGNSHSLKIKGGNAIGLLTLWVSSLGILSFSNEIVAFIFWPHGRPTNTDYVGIPSTKLITSKLKVNHSRYSHDDHLCTFQQPNELDELLVC